MEENPSARGKKSISIHSVVVYASLAAGLALIAAVIWTWIARQKFGAAGFSFISCGSLLLGISIWSHATIEAGPFKATFKQSESASKRLSQILVLVLFLGGVTIISTTTWKLSDREMEIANTNQAVLESLTRTLDQVGTQVRQVNAMSEMILDMNQDIQELEHLEHILASDLRKALVGFDDKFSSLQTEYSSLAEYNMNNLRTAKDIDSIRARLDGLVAESRRNFGEMRQARKHLKMLLEKNGRQLGTLSAIDGGGDAPPAPPTPDDAKTGFWEPDEGM